MLSNTDYHAMDAVALAAGLRRGDFSAVELTRTAIALVESRNPAINAIVASDFEAAEAAAAAVDAAPAAESPLAGLPFLIKDLSACRGLPLSYGSALYRNHRAERDSAIVARYRDAGLIILGKTNTPEFGLTITTEPALHGPTRNPWQPDFSVGGSSGGAAAAVAAGIVPVAHATDGGGSIRIPASCCGLFGLKPSRGLTVIEPRLGDCWSGMSVGHVVSRSVRDSAAFLDLITLEAPVLFPLPPRPAAFAPALEQAPGSLRIALQVIHPHDQEIAEDCLRATRTAAAHCEALGHRVEEIATPLDYGPVARAMNTLILVHTWQAVDARLQVLGQELAAAPMEHSTRLMAELGSRITADDYIAARDTLDDARRRMQAFHRDHDVILSPTLSLPPARLGWLNMNDADQRAYGERYRRYTGFTALFNGTGQPSMSVPTLNNAEGLPVGTLFSADWGRDLLLLRLARQLEEAEPWPLVAPESNYSDLSGS
ncbi:MAG: amidase [Pseudohongiellaceae bacterium]